ncbi:MinD superfamily P-loop ATPase [Methanocella conradii HZ254]|uniref:MinD superfamily P-loop ATPase n=1 Tax=Methanocella conradii (strain DSM 24694 / JCM 17849 / CGMCC 1.5162 / HZ254) TaxID=1041930 RepID=H8I4C0_METCZ|nr:ATP-binding protein [Methanocella conradii]AFC99677.1 MinD superfamily P-loop ATPase [Methanocella conradii HZ254]MDI6896607.1 ATP-binding protein [Methanocella conradii]
MTIQVAVVSGKGGTGKTTVTASLAAMCSPVIADCDVDAANLHLLLKPTVREKKPYFGHKFPEVDAGLCAGCGACETYCRFGAIKVEDRAVIDLVACEACGVCEAVCPAGAVSMKDRPCGEVFISDTAYGPMVHARLDPGVGTAGKLVTMVREEALKLAGKDGILLIDGPPGIGCPVIATLAGVDVAVIVVEPTVSGYSDFTRVLSVARRFKAMPCVCINKHDLNEDYTRKIIDHCEESGVRVLGCIPYGREIFECVRVGEIPALHNGIKDSYTKIFKNLNDAIEERMKK